MTSLAFSRPAFPQHVRVTARDRIMLEGKAHLVESRMNEGFVFVREGDPERRRFLSHAGLLHMLEQRVAVIEYGAFKH